MAGYITLRVIAKKRGRRWGGHSYPPASVKPRNGGTIETPTERGVDDQEAVLREFKEREKS